MVVRSRPMTEKEISNGYKQIVEMSTEHGVIELHPPNSNQPNASSLNNSANLTSSLLHNSTRSTNTVGSNNANETIKQFTFDAVFDCNSKQSEIYDEIMRPIVDSVLEGFNGKFRFLIFYIVIIKYFKPFFRHYFCLWSDWYGKNIHNEWNQQ